VKHRTAALVAALTVFGAGGFVALLQAAPMSPNSVPLEVWGLEAGDEVTIDGVAVTVRSGGAPRSFVGDPDATNAPVLHEVSAGKHEIAVRRAGCAPRTVTVLVESASKRAIVLEPEDPDRCALPLAPARR
jgi:hypothetical protein